MLFYVTGVNTHSHHFIACNLVWSVTCSGTVNIFGQFLQCKSVHFRFADEYRSGAVRTCSLYLFIFSIYCQLVCQRVCAPTSRVRKITISPHSYQPLIFFMFVFKPFWWVDGVYSGIRLWFLFDGTNDMINYLAFTRTFLKAQHRVVQTTAMYVSIPCAQLLHENACSLPFGL